MSSKAGVTHQAQRATPMAISAVIRCAELPPSGELSQSYLRAILELPRVGQSQELADASAYYSNSG